MFITAITTIFNFNVHVVIDRRIIYFHDSAENKESQSQEYWSETFPIIRKIMNIEGLGIRIRRNWVWLAHREAE